MFDCFGADAKSQLPTYISYEGVPKIYVNNWDLGLDFALLPLRGFYVEGLKQNGIIPFEERHWRMEEIEVADAYGVLGFPCGDKKEGDAYADEWVRPLFVLVEPCDPPEDAPETEVPIFTAKLLSEKPASAVGLSGGPILAIKRSEGQTQYWVVAIQACWDKSERTVYGCPMKVIAGFFREALKQHAKNTS